jgi:hypothetical protein
MQRLFGGHCFGGLWAGWLAAVAILATGSAAAQEPGKSPESGKTSEPAKTTEPQATSQPAAFEVVLLSLKGDWQAMRFHSQSGEAWYAFQGNWKPVPEADNNKPPAGDYRVQMSPTGENDWIAIRLERKSGRTWRLAALKWVEMKVLEPEKPKGEAGLEL